MCIEEEIVISPRIGENGQESISSVLLQMAGISTSALIQLLRNLGQTVCASNDNSFEY